MENEGDLDNVDNKISGYPIEVNLPWMYKRYFVREKNILSIVIEIGLCLFEALAWTICLPFMAIKDIIFAFWHLITKQWYKLSLIAFILDICILDICVFGILFFIPGLPAIIYGFGLASLIISVLIPLLCIIVNTVKFMMSEKQSFYAYEVNGRDGYKQNVFLTSIADDLKNTIEQNLKPIDRFRMDHKTLYFYFDSYEVLEENKVAYKRSFLDLDFCTKSPSTGLEVGIWIFCCSLFPVIAPILGFVILFLIFKFGRDEDKEEKNTMIGGFICFLFFDLLLVFDVLFFISGMPVAIWWIGLISLVLTCIVDILIVGSIRSFNYGHFGKVRLYSCKQGSKKYFKIGGRPLLDQEEVINVSEVKPEMGVFLPVRD